MAEAKREPPDDDHSTTLPDEVALSETTVTRPEAARGRPASGEPPVEALAIDTIRTLAMDAVQRAGSGHPGTAMALAPVAYCLWMRHLRFSPSRPDWFDRDRFVLSAGHASILQYAMLHLTGYDLPVEELQRFRQAGSMTPGHPENFITVGVETTTGPLGQGVANSVGLAMAEAHLGAVFNRPGHEIVDHRTYAICSDGDIMEGLSSEAASLAGHLGLGKLTWLYDDNHITIDGDTAITFSEDVAGRFQGLGWHVQKVADANDLAALDAALEASTSVVERPSLIIVRSHIGYGSPNKQDTPDAHGAPLGEDEVRRTKEVYGWPPEPPFFVPDRVRAHMGGQVERGKELVAEWEGRLARYGEAHPELAAELRRRLAGELPEGWDAGLPRFEVEDGPLATRAASGKTLVSIAERVPELVGGSADLSGSNNTLLPFSPNFSRETPEGRNLRWGIREHAMAAASNGLALHGGLRPYAATFLIFSDYARPAIRLAALMKLPVIYVFTHDSIGLGGDGPTHQPVEHLASLRAMPNLCVVRPADANEVRAAWRIALTRREGPTALVLTRQKIPVLPRDAGTEASGLTRGAYVLQAEEGDAPDVVLLASGSEVQFAVEARLRLAERDVDARVVSFPSWELFRAQDQAYRDGVLPPGAPRVAMEAGSRLGWREWVGPEGAILSVDRFGQSGSYADNYRDYGLTTDALVSSALEVSGKGD